MLRVIFATAMLVPAVAGAQGVGDIAAAIQDKATRIPSTSIVDVKSAVRCPTGANGEIVVCGSKDKKYGPDADVMTAAEAAPLPPMPDSRERATARQCGTGGNLCDSGQIPVTAIALAGAKAVIQAVKGEEWKEVFRTRPDEYQRYLAARNRRQARARVSVGVRAGSPQ